MLMFMKAEDNLGYYAGTGEMLAGCSRLNWNKGGPLDILCNSSDNISLLGLYLHFKFLSS